MNFWNIDAGQIATILTFVGSVVFVIRRLDRYGMEHEMLMDDLCERTGREKEKLITRQKTGFLRGH